MEGSVYLKLWLSTREDRGLNEEDDTLNAIEEHKNIYSVVSEHFLNRCEVQPGVRMFFLFIFKTFYHFCRLHKGMDHTSALPVAQPPMRKAPLSL